jgi:hypothetical protein
LKAGAISVAATAVTSAAVSAAIGLAGCAWSTGGGFAQVQGGSTFTVKLPMGKGRLDQGGRWITSNGYALTLDGSALTVATATVDLVGAAGTSGAAAFSPAKPPAGYTLCHSGHCHRTDGALIPYAEVEADLIRGAGGVATRSLAALAWDLALTAIKPDREGAARLKACTPSCLLPRGTIAGADLTLATLGASGTVEAMPGTPALAGSPRAWTLSLKDLTTFKGNLIQAVDRDGPGAFTLNGTFALSDKLFDGIDWAAFAGTSPIALDSSPAAVAVLKANLAASNWTPVLQAQSQ